MTDATSTVGGGASLPGGRDTGDGRRVVGIDVGGSGIKAALVDVSRGEFASERQRIETPRPATPAAIAEVVGELVTGLGGADLVGATMPAVVRNGVVRSAANIDSSWIGTDARELFRDILGVPCLVVNDADAAGVAEMRFGAGRDRRGVVILLTLGTGIGSAVFTDGVLVPNTELGHLHFKGGAAEKYAAASVRDRKDLSWKKWGHRVGRYLRHVEALFSPDLVILGGGVSKHFADYERHIRDKMGTETEVVPAQALNRAGIVGAAVTARELPSNPDRTN